MPLPGAWYHICARLPVRSHMQALVLTNVHPLASPFMAAIWLVPHSGLYSLEFCSLAIISFYFLPLTSFARSKCTRSKYSFLVPLCPLLAYFLHSALLRPLILLAFTLPSYFLICPFIDTLVIALTLGPPPAGAFVHPFAHTSRRHYFSFFLVRSACTLSRVCTRARSSPLDASQTCMLMFVRPLLCSHLCALARVVTHPLVDLITLFAGLASLACLHGVCARASTKMAIVALFIYVCEFIELHIITQSGPAMLISLNYLTFLPPMGHQ